MRECFDNIRDSERVSIPKTIDAPVTFMGYTITELLCALATSAPFFFFFRGHPVSMVGLCTGIATAILTKKYRKVFIKGYFVHLCWSIGIPLTKVTSPIKGSFYSAYRKRSFGP